jgi:hypothetical protein
MRWTKKSAAHGQPNYERQLGRGSAMKLDGLRQTAQGYGQPSDAIQLGALKHKRRYGQLKLWLLRGLRLNRT